jgi:hypothetical protein
MTPRIILSSVLAGIVMFLWGAVSHMFLGLGDAGLQPLPNEDQALASLRQAVKEPGLYFFPGEPDFASLAKDQHEAARQAWTEKFRTGPYGLMVYHPNGTEPMSPGQLGIQVVTDIFVAFILACLLQATPGLRSVGGRTLFVAVIGGLTGLAILVPYWNWYGFPAKFTAANIIDQIIAFSLGGLVLAKLLKPAAPPEAGAGN